MVLAAVGKNGTGKDFFLEYVAKTYGFPMISIGDVVRELETISTQHQRSICPNSARPSSPK